MKHVGKALITAGALSLCGCVFLGLGTRMLYIEQRNGASQNDSEYEEKQYITQANGITEIKTDVLWDNVYVEPGEGDQIEINYFDEINDLRYQITENNGTLLIVQKPSYNFQFFNIPDLRFGWESEEKRTITIKVPESYIGSYDLNLSSGTLSIRDMEMKDELEVYATSGIVKLNNIICEKDAEVEITSGNVSIEGMEVQEDMTCRFTSGHINTQNLTVDGDMTIRATSGNINMNDAIVGGELDCDFTSGKIIAETVSTGSVSATISSGTVILNELTLEKGIEADITSGTVRVSLTDDEGNYRINSDVTSGRCNLPENFGNGDKYIDVEVTSGNVDFTFTE